MVAIAAAAAGVLAIGEKVKAIAKRVTLRPYILLQVGVLIGGEVSVKRGSVIVQVEIVQV